MTADDRKQVAFVQWHDLIGGAETFTSALVPELRRLGVDASIILIGEESSAIRSLADQGVPVEVLGHPRGRSVLGDLRQLRAATRRLGRDAVVLPDLGFLAPALRLYGYRGTIVAVEHGSVLQIQRLPRGPRLFRKLERRASYRSADIQVAVSDFIANVIANGSASKKQVRIHNGVPLRELPATGLRLPQNGTIWCGMLGRLAEGKGFEVAVRAIAELEDQPHVKLAIFGDGPVAPALEALATRLGVADRVELHGWSTPEAAWTSSYIGLTIPNTIIEGFGLSALEAQSYGIPVIATQSGGLSEIVQAGRSGVFVRPNDPIDTAGAIRAYVSDPEIYRRHSEGAAEVGREFDIREVAGRYAALLQSTARN